MGDEDEGMMDERMEEEEEEGEEGEGEEREEEEEEGGKGDPSTSAAPGGTFTIYVSTPNTHPEHHPFLMYDSSFPDL